MVAAAAVPRVMHSRVAAALDALTILGGGDTNVIVEQTGLTDKFSFISTGGGSFLEFLEGKEIKKVIVFIVNHRLII